MKRFFFASIVLLAFFPAHACLNLYHTNESGTHSMGELDYTLRVNAFIKKDLIWTYKYKMDSLKVKVKYDDYSDYGVVLLKAGYFKEGLQIFRYLNRTKPNEYNIIANLATAYELNGNNDSALLWIRRALQLRADSHHGSEWIHLNILEAKKKEASKPGSLAGLNLAQTNLVTVTPAKAANAFYYQMHERIPFSPVPDPYLAKLMEDMGDLVMKHISVSEAWKLYSVAQVYATAASPVLQAKINRARQLTETYRARAPKRTNMRHWDTPQSIEKLTASFRNHRHVRVTEISPVLFHKE